MRGNLALTVLLALVVLFSGCISTEVTHIQHADGSAEIVQSTDMSALTSLAGSSSTYSDAMAGALENVCDKYEENVTCSEQDGVITLKKRFKASEAFYKFEVKDDIFVKRYRLTVDRIESLGDVSSSALSSNTSDSYYSSYSSPYGTSLGSYGDLGKDNTITLSSPSSKLMGNLLEQMKMEYTYTVQMPGRISEAKGAVAMNDSEARFDLIERMQNRKPIVVESEEMNWPLIMIVGIVGFMGVVLVALAVMVMLKPKQV